MTASTVYPGNYSTPALSQRILRFPLTRILLAVVFFMVPFLLIQGAATHLFEEKLFSRLGQLMGVFVACASYALYVTKIERRAVSELSIKGAWREYGTGFVVGGLMVCAAVAGIAAMGGLRVLSMSPSSLIVLPLILHVTVGIIEEMLMRGIFFRIVQEYLGSWLALTASGLVFGAMHLGNDNISVLGFANITAAGVLLASAYLLTGRLWLCAGLHAAWNFFQDGIFSVAVSGKAVKTGLLVTERSGPEWLTGGEFGIEGSAIALAVVLLATAAMLAVAQRQGHMVRPFWRR
jgi:membrane protease YdiL (CAAX protease family)